MVAPMLTVREMIRVSGEEGLGADGVADAFGAVFGAGLSQSGRRMRNSSPP